MFKFMIVCRRLFLAIFLLNTINITAQPVISSFTPASGPVASPVTITGTNFNAVPTNNIIYFGAVKANVISGSTTNLTASAPAGATYKPISILDNSTGLTAFASRPYITTFANPFGTGIPAGFYAPKVDFVTGTNPRNVETGDLDGDGKPDIVISNGNSNTLSVLRNISSAGIINTSSFAPKVDFASGNFTAYFKIGDIDGDGKLDLVVVNSNNLSVLRNTSTPGTIDASSFAAKIDFDLVFVGPVFVTICDLDLDGKPELISANAASNSSSILRNTSTPGSISFAPKVTFATGGSPSSVSSGDADGDGKPDLLFTNAALSSNTVSVLRNTSTPGVISFNTKVDFPTGMTPRSVAIGDLDGDGKPDLAIANSEATSTTLSVLRNTSTSGTIDATSFAGKIDFTTGILPNSIAIGDADGDSKPDLVVSNVNSNTVSVFRNTSTTGFIDITSFAAKVDFTTGTSPVGVAIGDMEGDGIPEILTANGTAATVSVLQIDLAAIPVMLTNVTAYVQNTGVKIEWVSHQEITVERYEVERSLDGRQFNHAGTVTARGNSSVALRYSLFDPSPYKGISFYRIKIIEQGQVAYSNIIKVNTSIMSENSISIYPNPAIGNSIGLNVNLPKGTYTISVTNTTGQEVFKNTFLHDGGKVMRTILLPKIVSGFYQLQLTGEGLNLTTQLLKQ